MYELKPCPFCGGAAEMYTDGDLPYRTHFLKTKEEAEQKVEEYKKYLVPRKITIKEWTGTGSRRHKRFFVEVCPIAFIPRCLDTRCIGRNKRPYYTEAEAVEAWNRRHPNENPETRKG